MKKVAILTDGDSFANAIEDSFPLGVLPHGATAEVVYENAVAT